MQHLRVLGFALLFASTAAQIGCASGTPPGERDAQSGLDAATDAAQGDGGAPCAGDAECDDGDPCNGVETCSSGLCARGAAVDCDDGVSCTDDLCDTADGSCRNDPDHTACAADLVCDPSEGCIPPPPCSTDEDCDDGLFCNGVETCDAAFGCRPGTAPACDDGVACTTDACDPLADGGAGACAHTNDSAACSDGRACNGVETCDPTSAMADASGCVIGAAPDCDDGVACTTDACDESAGGCVNPPDPTSCQDGVFCNGAEVCDPVTGCVPGTPPSCDDSIGCTTGRCDAATDACVQEADTAFCQDGLVCNGTETCDVSGVTPGTGCVAGVPIGCSDGLACTTDMCNEPAGTCTHGGSDADGDGYTAVGCGAGDDCNDLSAAIHPGATELCDGVDNDCSGAADDGGGMECAVGSGARTCTTSCGTAGSRTCTAACTLTPCVASAETCNDCDDDGDGLVDDGLPCRRGTVGACTTTCGTAGARTCASDCSGYGTCAAPTETCNDCDDDADGVIDDGLPCRRGTSASCTTSCGTSGTRVCALDCSGYGSCRAASETCNGCDDDANGLVDDGFACRQGATTSCTTACGTAGVRTCASDCSGYGACVATEVCNGCDDDGDGTADEGFSCAAGASRGCTTGCGTSGTQTCNGSCSGYGACTAAEACNGCDDDGDGTADEDFACRAGATMGCTTSCGTAGTRTCSATCSGFGACSAAEVCNGCDDDGVGGADDTFACVQGSSRSCTTTCGTTGTQACNGTCSAYSTCSATEVCNGCDDDGVGGADNGFTCAQGSSMACTTSCGTPGNRTCNGSCTAYGACAGAEVCNGCDDDGVGGADNGFTCVQGATTACTTACGTAGTRTCNGTCTGFSTCAAPAEVCGNGCDDNGNGAIDEGCCADSDITGPWAFGYEVALNRRTLSAPTTIALTDDAVSAAIPIGFSYSFFGSTFTSAYVSSNGFVALTSPASAGCCSGATLPSTSAPSNLIAGFWEDLNPSLGGTVRYQTIGAAPNRELVVEYDNVQHFGGGNPVTMQIVLRETTNEAEIVCVSCRSDGGTHTQGVQNAGGTFGYSMPGRNASTRFGALGDAVRYVTGVSSGPDGVCDGSDPCPRLSNNPSSANLSGGDRAFARPITAAPRTLTAPTTLSMTDDLVSAALPLGFSYDFFGTSFTSAYVSSNGFVTFDAAAGAGCCSGQALPTSATYAANMIAMFWEDLYPPGGGTVRYQTLGTAPNREWVVEFSGVPHFSSGNNVTMQLVLRETTNEAEVICVTCPTDGGTHTQGVQNGTRSYGYAVSGREAASFALTSDAVVFSTFTGEPNACALP